MKSDLFYVNTVNIYKTLFTPMYAVGTILIKHTALIVSSEKTLTKSIMSLKLISWIYKCH